ncbi:hypothetical protein GH811_18070 [Acetobacterium malicum]|uniref:Uncharacterized protein n=1 Tax=Acetobacterium malicum TaxID=52692 RepID=A0ABR6Z1V3_9FIRM|nr:hypothetical protein [Acetobacterium malicum]MBC3901508.1 hypothetical protein [Acetobacterium malicum]
MSYSTQKVIEILEKKGFVAEESEQFDVLHFRAPGYKEIKMKSDGIKHYFKVLTKFTTDVKTALEWAGVDKLEDVA